MGVDLEKMRQRVLDMNDPQNPYSQEDFNKEFNSTPNLSDYKLDLKTCNKSDNEYPEYATVGSSGFDLRANIIPVDNERGGMIDYITIKPFKRAIVPTGLYFEIPENFEIQVRPRSGLAAKYGITVLNTPGTIDADYRGELQVILINLGDEDFVIKHGDRIAQGIFASVIGKNYVNMVKIDNISENTERGSGGFGSTGRK